MIANEKVSYVNNKKRRHRVAIFALGPNNTILASMSGYGGGPELPGGAVDKNESNVAAGLREVAEESGWECSGAFELTLQGDWTFKGKDDGWFNSDGWQEEENIPIICNAIDFKPTTAYDSAHDALVFKLEPIDKVIAGIEKITAEGISERYTNKNKFILYVLGYILDMAKTKPNWMSW